MCTLAAHHLPRGEVGQQRTGGSDRAGSLTCPGSDLVGTGSGGRGQFFCRISWVSSILIRTGDHCGKGQYADKLLFYVGGKQRGSASRNLQSAIHCGE